MTTFTAPILTMAISQRGMLAVAMGARRANTRLMFAGVGLLLLAVVFVFIQAMMSAFSTP